MMSDSFRLITLISMSQTTYRIVIYCTNEIKGLASIIEQQTESNIALVTFSRYHTCRYNNEDLFINDHRNHTNCMIV
jgi:hypothetical protein